MWSVAFITAPVLHSCASPQQDSQKDSTLERQGHIEGVDDGSYLAQIDPLGGQWQVVRIGATDFMPFKAWVNFSSGGFLNHGAGCAGGYPAFYRLENEKITVMRLEPVRIGKCAGTAELANATATARTIAADSERKLASFIDQLSMWERVDGRLVLTARDGTRAILSQPMEQHPEIAGRWQIESIGGTPFITERRPANLSIGMGSIGAVADCNSTGAQFTILSPGRISVKGPFMSTAIGCAPEDYAEDEMMTRAMGEATAYRLVGDRLMFSGGPGMVDRRPPPPDRQLVGEYEACGNTLLGAYHEGPIRLTISATSMTDNAQCTAGYSVNGPNITLKLDEKPECQTRLPPYVPGHPHGIGGSISTLSATRPDGFAFNQQGQLILRTNRGLLTMCRKGGPRPFGG